MYKLQRFWNGVAFRAVGRCLPALRGGIGVLGALLALSVAPATRAEDARPFCESCRVTIGVGETYHFWTRTGGVVVPVTLEWSANRYELGIFRMSTRQELESVGRPPDHVAAHPYWGLSLSRRWQLFRFSRTRLFIGLGGAYKSETDELSSTHWNFAEQLGARIELPPGTSPGGTAAIELTIRHWSNAGLHLPNRGQDFFTLTYSF